VVAGSVSLNTAATWKLRIDPTGPEGEGGRKGRHDSEVTTDYSAGGLRLRLCN